MGTIVERGATVIVDAFWGDAGKGAVGAWLAYILNAKMAFRGCGGPGAEHGIFFQNRYIKTNQLPLSFLLQGCDVGLGPGTAVDPVKLFEEIQRFHLSPEQVRIDPRCPIVTREHIRLERNSANMKKIGSTFSGMGRCMSDAVLRTAILAKDVPELRRFIEDVPNLVNEIASKQNIILESSQGFGLSRYFGFDNFVTSVDVTTGSVIAGVGLDWRLIKKVVLVVKALPTREGTGPMGNVDEFTPEEMKKLGIAETSSIINIETGKPQIRRKAKSIDWDMLKKAAMVTGATEVALTFAEHFDTEVNNATKWSMLTKKVLGLIGKIEKVTDAPVTIVNTGKPFTSFVTTYERSLDLSEETLQRLNSYCQR